MESDLLRAWQLIHELSEQNAHNQKIAAALQAQARALQDQAVHSGNGFSLRRFNTDISKEVFESETERTNAQIIIENQTLHHDNKQLNMLLKEYDQTMDTVMNKFRSHSAAAQQHELTLSRHYETLLASRENPSTSNELANNLGASMALQRLTHNLRALLQTYPTDDSESSSSGDSMQPASPPPERSDWALERESEIARLADENEALRRLLEIDAASAAAHGLLPAERADSDRYTALFANPLNKTRELAPGSFGGLGMPAGWGGELGVRPAAAARGVMVTQGAGMMGMGMSALQQHQQMQALERQQQQQRQELQLQQNPGMYERQPPPDGRPAPPPIPIIQRSNADLQPGMRGGTQRRPAMFGQGGGGPGAGAGAGAGRGRGAGPGPGYWGPTSERNWPML